MSPESVPSPGRMPVVTSEVAEAIAAKDLNNLYLTSCYFADPQRYAAFCSLYALMRVIDDRVDELPQDPEAFDAAAEHAVLDGWEKALFGALGGEPPPAGLASRCGMPEARTLIDGAVAAMRRFPFPDILWRNFFVAMHRDVEQVRFESYDDFLAYTEGASVAPTSIYLYLVAAGRLADGGGTYRLPADFDLIRCGRHLGVFSYLAHILRDLALDLATGERGLLYLARDDLDSFGLDEAQLRRDLERRHAGEPLRRLAAELARRARDERRRGLGYLEPLAGRLEADCAFILEVILEIYRQALDKLAACDYDPMAGRHHLSLEEKLATAARTAERLGFEPPADAFAGRPAAAAADPILG